MQTLAHTHTEQVEIALNCSRHKCFAFLNAETSDAVKPLYSSTVHHCLDNDECIVWADFCLAFAARLVESGLSSPIDGYCSLNKWSIVTAFNHLYNMPLILGLPSHRRPYWHLALQFLNKSVNRIQWHLQAILDTTAYGMDWVKCAKWDINITQILYLASQDRISAQYRATLGLPRPNIGLCWAYIGLI